MDLNLTNLLLGTIGAIASVSAAIIYYYTLNELKKQRENTYRPHLFVDNAFFYVQGVQKNENIMPLKWCEKTSDIKSIISFENDNIFASFSIKCYNIGFGTATNIKINFQYDIIGFILDIKSLEKRIPKKKRINIENNGTFLSFEPENKELPFSSKSFSTELNLNQYVSYILPVNINKDIAEINIPRHFLELINIMVYYNAILKEKKEKDLNIPEVKLNITYKDISNRNFKKELKISTKMILYGLACYNGEFVINLNK